MVSETVLQDWATTCVIILTQIKLYMHQNSRAITLVAIDLIDHSTCLASQYSRNKASGLSHTHLNTLNSDHFMYGSVSDKLQQSYTPPIYPG